MIHFLDDLILDDLAQPFYIEQKACIRIGVSLDRHIEIIVMSMPVLIGALAEYLFVLFFTPARIIELMCRIKMFQACQIHHTTYTLKLPAKVIHTPKMPATMSKTRIFTVCIFYWQPPQCL